MPLAADLRPKDLAGFVGQEKLVGETGPIRKLIESQQLPSIIFWGPPGSGKTTLAEIIANSMAADLQRLSAVTQGKDDLKKVIVLANLNYQQNKTTILFIDEIHRWNKAQQDALLPYVESGVITLIGATTENPSFSIISPLLSRCKVFVLESHDEKAVIQVLKKGAERLQIKIKKPALEFLVQLANGDLRTALTNLEIAAQIAKHDQLKAIELETVKAASQSFLRYDKNGEEKFNLISAVHKSLRSSNADAACYWIMRMLISGEDPLYVARRLIRFASEDIGMANSNALLIANLAYDTCKKIGMPECELALMQSACYLANCPRDNSLYIASSEIKKDLEKYGNLPVPLHLRNAPTKLMSELGYSKGYEYDHDLESKKSDQQCLPDQLKSKRYFPNSKQKPESIE